MHKPKKMEGFLIIFLACCLALGQLFVAPAAQAVDIGIFINGKQLQTAAAPYIQNGRVMVPFRALFEALGATVNWDEDRRAVTGVRNGSEVRLTIDSSTAYVNNTPNALDAPAVITGGSTFVPLHFVGEALGAGVQWDGADNAVKITLKGSAAGAASASAAANGPKSFTIKDAYGDIVQVPCPPKRIVSCNANVSMMIAIMGSAGSIVGRSTSTVFPPYLQSKADMGSAFTPSVEKIVSMKPDIFFGYGSGYTPAAILAQIKAHGIPVVLLDCYRPDHFISDIQTLGKILGKDNAADDYINNFYLKYLKLVADRVGNIPIGKRPLVYFEQYNAYSTVAYGNVSDQLINEAGGRNIASDFRAYNPTVSSEWVIAKNPVIVFKLAASTAQSGYTHTANNMKPLQEAVMERPGWSNISAIKSGKVYIMSDQLNAGPFEPVAVLDMAKCFYPDLFKDIDPPSIHREWLSRLYNLPYNGAWFYPELQ